MTQIEDAYRNGGAALLPNLFARELVDALTYQVSRQIKAGGARLMRQGPLVDRACPELSGMQWPVLLTFLWGLTPRIEAATGVPLLPTYSYFRLYHQGDRCRVHADRRACEHSLSLTLAYSDDLPWPLSVASEPTDPNSADATAIGDDFGRQSWQDYSMQAGDAVLYRGIDYRHGRLEPNPNRWSAHLFMHWVARDGEHRDCAFDGKAMAGGSNGPGFP